MSGLKGNQKRGGNGKFEANPVAKPTRSLIDISTRDFARIEGQWYALDPIDEVGECDQCGADYDTGSRDGRCGDCGYCADCCKHLEDNECEECGYAPGGMFGDGHTPGCTNETLNFCGECMGKASPGATLCKTCHANQWTLERELDDRNRTLASRVRDHLNPNEKADANDVKEALNKVGISVHPGSVDELVHEVNNTPQRQIRTNGDIVYMKAGTFHREDGPALISGENDDQWWYREGKLHRENGPAVVGADGYEAWYQNDVLHREDGPALRLPDGTETWFINGNEQSR